MIDEMIASVTAAFAPGADAATKQQAATILRGLLTMLESGTVGASAAPPPGGTTTPAPAPPGDFLAAIVESVRPFLPAEALADLPRFRVPLIKLGG